MLSRYVSKETLAEESVAKGGGVSACERLNSQVTARQSLVPVG